MSNSILLCGVDDADLVWRCNFSLGDERMELFGITSNENLTREELALKSKAYKRKAKEFQTMVKVRRL